MPYAPDRRWPIDGRIFQLSAASLSALCLLAACGETQHTAADERLADGPVTSASRRVTQPSVASRLTLARRANAAALSAVLAEAKRRGWRDLDVAPVQSFRIMQDAQHLATLATGEATVPGAVNAGCFFAVVKDGNVALISTIGVGDYEAETCMEPLGVGLLSSRDPVRFGTVFNAASPNAMVREPIVIEWDRDANTLLIDEALSNKASQAGAQTIAAMKKLL